MLNVEELNTSTFFININSLHDLDMFELPLEDNKIACEYF